MNLRFKFSLVQVKNISDKGSYVLVVCEIIICMSILVAARTV